MSERWLLRGGAVADGDGGPLVRADVLVAGGRIEAVGPDLRDDDAAVIEAAGAIVLPGFIDTHSHADGAVFDDTVQSALLAQGVTSVVVGQDGVSYAPGDGGYASEYFAAINGPHPAYSGGGVGSLLRSADRATRVNVGYLVPAGTVRHEVLGFEQRAADAGELERMADLVAAGMRDGALGLSSGLDYVPGAFASADELAALCAPVARVGGVYVTHMRGGYERNAGVGVAEIARIAELSSVRPHISHFHGPTELLASLLDGLARDGVRATFDAYPYRAGCTLVAMLVLPPALLAGSSRRTAGVLRTREVRDELLTTWLPQLQSNPDVGADWPDRLTFAHIAAPEFGWAHGASVRDAARAMGSTPLEAVLDILVASELEVTGIVRVRAQRSRDELAELFRRPEHLAGSDGIYVGAHPHPRAWGAFARYLRMFVRERGDLSWPEVATHLASRAADRFGLANRGRVRPGLVADLVVVDPEAVADLATYERPRQDAAGVIATLVSGEPVYRDGRLLPATPGRALRPGPAGDRA